MAWHLGRAGPVRGHPATSLPSRTATLLLPARFICLPDGTCSRKAPGGSRLQVPPCLQAISAPSPQAWAAGTPPTDLLQLLAPPAAPTSCAQESFAPIYRQEVAAVASCHLGFLSIRKLSLNLAQQELERFPTRHPAFGSAKASGTWELRRSDSPALQTPWKPWVHAARAPEARVASWLPRLPIKTVKILVTTIDIGRPMHQYYI